MDQPEVLKAKVCLVGDAAVGKSSLIRRYVEDTFDDRYVTTLGSKVSLKRVWLSPEGESSKGFEVQLSIWDLLGERSYLSTLHQEYLKGAQGLIAVCDITRYSTFEVLDEWIQAAFQVAGEIPVVILVNKIDLRDQIICLYDDHEPGEKAARYRGFATWTSAKTGQNVNPAFGQLTIEIVRRFAAPMLSMRFDSA